MDLPYGPTYTTCFIATKLDTCLLIEAGLSNQLSLYPYRITAPESGFIFISRYDHYDHRECDRLNWEFVDSDGPLEISRHLGLFKKRMYLELRGMWFELISYYRPWDVVAGLLVSPYECSLDKKLRDDSIAPTEIFLMQMKVRRYTVISRCLFTKSTLGSISQPVQTHG